MKLYILKYMIQFVLCIFSISAQAYFYLQEDTQLVGYWNMVTSSTMIIPGIPQTKNTPGVIKISFHPTADFLQYRVNNGEQTSCLSGCSNGVFYYTPYIELDQWRKGAAVGIPSSFSLVNENGNSQTFSAVGSFNREANLIITDASDSPIRDFGDGLAMHYSPWIGSFQLPYDVPYLFHGRNNESYTFTIPLSVPVGTEAGTYTNNKSELFAKVNYQYCGKNCSPNFNIGKRWINKEPLFIKVFVPNICSFSDSNLTINYKSVSLRDIQGKNGPSVSTTLSCNSPVVRGTLTLKSLSGSNWASSIGTSVKVKDKLDVILKVNDNDASHGIIIPIGEQGGTVKLKITSMLNANGNIPESGPFLGNAILVFAPS
ncbi:MrpH family fimbial adhesin [Escherichia coli]|uniref:MrpH family fimbial adhesin n=1 Tax=Escherichia coli TaxID=562 RepID=UPI00215875C7|nr:hypothetical protein [Escherichia coli]